MSLPDYYQFMKSTKDQTNVSYDVTVAEFVNKWFWSLLLILELHLQKTH